MYGELQPVGGGDPIPLLKPSLVVGRRESSDIVLRFPNVSGTHCELSLVDGDWFVKDPAATAFLNAPINPVPSSASIMGMRMTVLMAVRTAYRF